MNEFLKNEEMYIFLRASQFVQESNGLIQLDQLADPVFEYCFSTVYLLQSTYSALLLITHCSANVNLSLFLGFMKMKSLVKTFFQQGKEPAN